MECNELAWMECSDMDGMGAEGMGLPTACMDGMQRTGWNGMD